jgi:acyl dehydratase
MKRTFADLRIGMTFTSPAHRLGEDEALEFARKFDPQPFHVDREAARHSLFKGLAVSGWYTAARVFSLVLQSGVELEGGIVGQEVEHLQWLAPVRPGDTLQVTSSVVAATPSVKDPRRGTVMLESIAVNQHGAPVFSMRARILAPAPK